MSSYVRVDDAERITCCGTTARPPSRMTSLAFRPAARRRCGAATWSARGCTWTFQSLQLTGAAGRDELYSLDVASFQSPQLTGAATRARRICGREVDDFNPRSSQELRPPREARMPRRCSDFNPRSSQELRRLPPAASCTGDHFNPRSSQELRRVLLHGLALREDISIPAAHRSCDTRPNGLTARRPANFNPRSSQELRPTVPTTRRTPPNFNPRSSQELRPPGAGCG